MYSLVGLLRSAAVVAVLSISFVSHSALADDWVANKLRGNVFALDGNIWVKLSRGDIVSDNRPIRTTRSGRAEFVREKESITIGGDTQISIADRNGRRYTVVHQTFGKVEIEAEKRDVQHFAVQTPYLAAVVKGTRFVVNVVGESANVVVTRGTVNAIDRINGLMTNITPGQSASSGEGQVLTVAGPGAPVITDLKGKEMAPGQLVAAAAAASNNGNGGGNGNGNNGNGNGNGGGNGNGNSGNGNGNGGGNGGNGGGNGGANGNGNSGNGNGNGG